MMIQAKGLTKNYGPSSVLKGLDLEIPGGQFVAIMGESGSGKTTFLNLLAGLDRADGGSLSVAGVELVGKTKDQLVSFRRDHLAMIFQDFHLLGGLSAFENLLLPLRLSGKTADKERLHRLLAQVGLEKVANAQAKNFSSGMFKRLGIAKLMLAKPRLLLLDEPYTGLDYKSVGFFNQFLGQFVQEGGAVLMITHQLDCCFELASKVAILEQGKIDSEHGRAQFNYETLIEHYQRATQ